MAGNFQWKSAANNPARSRTNRKTTRPGRGTFGFFAMLVCTLHRCTPFLAAWIVSAGLWLSPARGAEPKVEAKNGNVFLQTGTGEAKQLTTSGRDSRPVLSPDGRWVVFVRAVPGKIINTGVGETDAEELWQIGADGREPTRLVAPKQAKDMRNVVANFADLQFSTDGRLVYFVTDAYAVSGAVHVVDTTRAREHFLLAGSTVEVVPAGKYRDCLLVGQHRYFLGGGSYDWVWLFRPDGKEVGPVGEDAVNFKTTYYPDDGKEREKP